MRRKIKCECNDRDPLICHECEESTGVCYCKCHDDNPAATFKEDDK